MRLIVNSLYKQLYKETSVNIKDRECQRNYLFELPRDIVAVLQNDFLIQCLFIFVVSGSFI